MAVEPKRRLITVDEYHRMAETGILGPEERVELLGGEIIAMTAIGSRHAACVRRLSRLFFEHLGSKAVVGVQDPVTLDDFSEPEPDVFLARVREDEYISAHPRPSDVLLLIEVADTSIGFDRERKTPRYARAGIPEVWIVELDEDVVEVCRGPVGDEYTERLRLVRGQDVSPEAFGEVSVAIEEILGAP
jgi:Uma2 family endonuclease